MTGTEEPFFSFVSLVARPSPGRPERLRNCAKLFASVLIRTGSGLFTMRDFANATKGDWLQRRAAELCLALAFGPALAWLKPFGLEEPPFFARLGFWSGVLACWFITFALTDGWLARSTRIRFSHPRARQAAVIGLAAFPMVLVAGGAIDVLKGWQPSVPEVTELYLQVIVVGSLMTLFAEAVIPGRMPRIPADGAWAPGSCATAGTREEPPAAPPPTAAIPPLIARLPPDVRGPLLCLEMQDHYVRVHTQRGSSLVLMRLRDAINETAPASGRQIHRSWWVSDSAVESFVRSGRACSVQLRNGVRAPVSHRYAKEVETIYAGNADRLGLRGP